MKRKFKIGDLVVSNHNGIGIITKLYWGNHKHFWVSFFVNPPSIIQVHQNFLEIYDENR